MQGAHALEGHEAVAFIESDCVRLGVGHDADTAEPLALIGRELAAFANVVCCSDSHSRRGGCCTMRGTNYFGSLMRSPQGRPHQRRLKGTECADW